MEEAAQDGVERAEPEEVQGQVEEGLVGHLVQHTGAELGSVLVVGVDGERGEPDDKEPGADNAPGGLLLLLLEFGDSHAQ